MIGPGNIFSASSIAIEVKVKAGRVDDDAGALVDRLVDPVDRARPRCSVWRNSIGRSPAAARHIASISASVVRAVDLRLALAEAVQVRAVQDVDRLGHGHVRRRQLAGSRTGAAARARGPGTKVMSASATIIAERNGSVSRTMSLQRHAGDVGHDEQQQAVGRRDQPEHDVDHDDDAEMHHVDAERLRGRDQHRHDDQQDRGALEQAAEHQQDDVDQRSGSRSATGRSRRARRSSAARDVLDGDDVVEDQRAGDQHADRGGRARARQQRVVEVCAA